MHDDMQRTLGWYYYREGKSRFVFKAKFIAAQPISPTAEIKA